MLLLGFIYKPPFGTAASRIAFKSPADEKCTLSISTA